MSLLFDQTKQWQKTKNDESAMMMIAMRFLLGSMMMKIASIVCIKVNKTRESNNNELDTDDENDCGEVATYGSGKRNNLNLNC